MGLMKIELDRYFSSNEFAGQLKTLSKIVQKEDGDTLMINLYYAQSVAIPSLEDMGDICSMNSPQVQRAETTARFQSESKCRLAGKKSCSLVSVSYKPTYSPTYIGLRYCEVLVITK